MLSTEKSDRHREIFHPATEQVAGSVDFANTSTINHVVHVATKRLNQWGHGSLTKRVQEPFAFRELARVNKEKIAELITAEHGKVLSDVAINARYGSAGTPNT